MAAPNTVFTYPLDGTNKTFDVPFEYLARKFVVITLIGVTRRVLVVTSEFRFVTKRQISTIKAWGPADGFNLIEMRRVTSATERLVDFADGSILRAYDLNTSQVQSLHIAEEARDLTADTIGVNNDGDLDARGRRIVNVADAVLPGDAVTLRQEQEWAASALNSRNGAETAKNLAETARDASQGSAQAAAISESNANNSKLAAATSATNAGNSATAANNSKVAAATSETNSGNSATAANNSKVAAKASEDAAKISETKAAASASGVNMPPVVTGDALKLLLVNSGGTGFSLGPVIQAALNTYAAGNVSLVGAFGGVDNSNYRLFKTASAASVDWDTLTGSGLYKDVNLGNAPHGPTPGVASYFYCLNFGPATDTMIQFAFPYSTGTTNRLYAYRTKFSGTWSTWNSVATLADIATLSNRLTSSTLTLVKESLWAGSVGAATVLTLTRNLVPGEMLYVRHSDASRYTAPLIVPFDLTSNRVAAASVGGITTTFQLNYSDNLKSAYVYVFTSGFGIEEIYSIKRNL